MLGRKFGLLASCALGAGAFLLPPGMVATTDDKAISFTPFEVDTKSQLVELPCSSCAFPAERFTEEQEHDTVFWTQGGANNLLLNFTVAEDGHSLLMNNGQIYPIQFNMLPEWYVQQIPASTIRKQLDSGDVEGTPLQITGYNLFKDDVEVVTPPGDRLVQMTMQLTSLEAQSMTIDQVLIQLLETTDDELLILSIEPIPGTAQPMFPFLDAPAPPFHDGHKKPPHKECHLLGPLCAIGDFLESKLGGKKHGRPGCTGKRPPMEDGHLPTHNRPHFGDKKHGDKKHDGSHEHHRHHKHGFFHAMSRAVLAVLVPVMAGITVGMLVSVLGLLTGRFIGWLWFTAFRGGKRGYERVAADDIIITVTDTDKEAVIVVDDSEPLPRYEDAPAYEQTEKEAL